MLRRLFVSASALDPELGSSESTLLDAEAKLALAGAAAEIVLAVDASKLGHRARRAASTSSASTSSSPSWTRRTTASTRTANMSTWSDGPRARLEGLRHERLMYDSVR